LKVLTVVGARPQFVKAAAFSRVLRGRHTEVLVHTGQHYDANLSAVFFEELDIARPDHHLEVGSGPQGRQVGQMLERLEPVLQRESPDWAVVFGDANSTLAGALAAAQASVPLAHVEAGLRSFDRTMPEEVNRIVADHVAALLFCPTKTAMDHAAREGLSERAHLTGDIMYDSLLRNVALAESRSTVLEQLRLKPGGFVLATVHRAANTDDQGKFARLLDAFAMLEEQVIFPMHPRARLALAQSDLETGANVRIIEPVGYLDMLTLQRHARTVLTDSGGVQKESYLLGVPCVTLREETEWPETLVDGWNVLAGSDPDRIVSAAGRAKPVGEPPKVFGDGRSAERMVQLLSDDRSHSRCLS
jgi:UDP-N-acetylglucosamine 2-epimerase